jgi:hypothetical protein
LALHVDLEGRITRVIALRTELTENQSSSGFEGVAVDGGFLYVCFQRPWSAAGDAPSKTRIGRYPLEAQGDWQFAHYALDAPASPNGGWVGLSELTALGDGHFAALERDNQGGTDAAIKRIYRFDANRVEWRTDAQPTKIGVLEKRLLRDLLAAGDYASTGGAIPEKLEGLCVEPNGRFLIVNDNDGADDNSGETQLLDLGPLLEKE